MDKPRAEVIAHSRAPNGEELITLEIELHRFILPEFNTHRAFSRNFQSSRAVPVVKIIDQVRNDPAIPVYWGKNQAGMVAEEESSNLVNINYFEEYDTSCSCDLFENKTCSLPAVEAWSFAAQQAVEMAEAFNKAGYHKQIVNRLLEPFMWTKGVVTATRDAYEGFFKLRCHKDAQPEIRLLAERMRDAIEASVPADLVYGEFHLPYVKWYRRFGSGRQTPYEGNYEKYCYKEEELEEYSLEEAVKISTSCCAQVSYRKLDTSLEKAEKIYGMLNLPENGKYKEDPPHCFDEQTEVLTSSGFKYWRDVSNHPLVIVDADTGKFKGFCDNYTKIEREVDEDVFQFDGKFIDLVITKGHNIYGSLINSVKDRKESCFKLFPANMETPTRSTKTYSAMRPMKMLRACVPADVSQEDISPSDVSLFKLYGFFVGDGALPTDGSVNTLKFHLKNKRKIEYLEDLCSNINDCSLISYKNGQFSVKLTDAKKLFSKFYTDDGKKTIPVEWALKQKQGLIDALFDGLKNSDGSLKRDTWTYSTSSEQLKEDIMAISPVFGYVPTISYTKTFDNNHNTNWVINFSNNREVLVNDPRSEQSTSLVNYKGKVYCADTGGNVLIIRRNGKILLSGNCSPTEHVAKVVKGDSIEISGNFHSNTFWQYRKALEKGEEVKFLEVE